MKKLALLIVVILFVFSACALEIANVIGPGGVYVFYDKGNYNGGWRYIGCSPHDFGELKNINEDSIKKALDLCEKNTGGHYFFPWELPDEAELKKMLECFSYGLTRFSPDYYYLALNVTSDFKIDDPATWIEANWEAVVLHKNFDDKLNGVVEKINDLSGFSNVIRVRPIRKF